MNSVQSDLPETLQMAMLYFQDEDRAHEFLTKFRWPDGKPTCPRCECQENSFISTRRIWKCKGCKRQFSAKSGTIMEDSPIALSKWLPAIWMICGCKNGVSSYEIARGLGVSQKTAWFMLHRVREAMHDGTIGTTEKLSGEVEADETFIGGKARNMHRKSKRYARTIADPNKGKTVVLGLLQREGTVRAAVAPSRRKHVIEENILDNVENGSKIYTDDHDSYRNLPGDYVRQFVNHVETYVEGRVHTNGLENFWSLLKRTIKGTYVSVDPAHLQAYVDEQAFRFNNREFRDADRFVSVLSQIAGKRLTFQGLISRNLDALLG
jgi:transposase-like protein